MCKAIQRPAQTWREAGGDKPALACGLHAQPAHQIGRASLL